VFPLSSKKERPERTVVDAVSVAAVACPWAHRLNVPVTACWVAVVLHPPLAAPPILVISIRHCNEHKSCHFMVVFDETNVKLHCQSIANSTLNVGV